VMPLSIVGIPGGCIDVPGIIPRWLRLDEDESRYRSSGIDMAAIGICIL
jgi:hypothetical protein